MTGRPPDLAGAEIALSKVVRETQRDWTQAMLRLIPALVEGAAGELLSRGLPATDAAVTRALRVTADDAIDLVDQLRAVVLQDPASHMKRARRLGALVVRAACGGAGGER